MSSGLYDTAMRPPASGRVSARTIQIGLGLIWLVDGLLQLQPKMFGPDFANDVILPMAQGQPGVVSSAITHVAHLVSVQPALADSRLRRRPDPHRRRPPRPRDGQAGARPLLRVGARRVGARRGLRHALHRHGVAAHRCAGRRAALRRHRRAGVAADGRSGGVGSGRRRRAARRTGRQGRLGRRVERHGDPVAAAGEPGRREHLGRHQQRGHGRAGLAGPRAAVGRPRPRERRGLGRRRLRRAVVRDRPRPAGLAPHDRLPGGGRRAGARLLDVRRGLRAASSPGSATDPNTGPLLVLLALAVYPNRAWAGSRAAVPGRAGGGMATPTGAIA